MREKSDELLKRQKIESQHKAAHMSGVLFIGAFIIAGLYALAHHLSN